MIALADARGRVADYVDALFLVYTVIIVAYVLSSLIFALGTRMPYSRVSDGVLSFLRDVSEPYLRVFRRFIPQIGMFDLSPIVGIFVLRIAQDLVDRLIRG